jgi:hypothetical protein
MLFTFLWNCLVFGCTFLIVNAIRKILEYIADQILSVPLNRNQTYQISALTEFLGFVIWLGLWMLQIIILFFSFIRIFKV